MAGAGAVASYDAIDSAANRIARFLRSRGIRRGDHVAYALENSVAVFEVMYACERIGVYYTPINTRLTSGEAAYIVEDSGSRAVFVSATFTGLGAALRAEPSAAEVTTWVSVGGDIPGYDTLDAMAGTMPSGAIEDPSPGVGMLYSSGTTGRPKGITRPLPSGTTGADPVLTLLARTYGFDSDTVYLCPAPLYHGAGKWYTSAMHRVGGTAVVMEKFDPQAFLAAIERYRVTHTQVVPTMLSRLLRLDPAERSAYDLSSLRVLLHAAAPCPVPLKEAAIEWLGPIVWEYYSATEANGMTIIGPEEWLTHKGSVGRAVIGTLHIVADDGVEVPGAGHPGTVFFEGTPLFEYHNDESKTAESRHPRGWTTTGDIGYLDDEGYLYLTDRRSFTIISGGVNIYPQEIENVLSVHPAVRDVAVFGVPHHDLGEAVHAAVQLEDPAAASPRMVESLVAWCRDRLAHFKCPRSVEFLDDLPREENGKLYKRILRDRHWASHGDAAGSDAAGSTAGSTTAMSTTATSN